MDLSNSEIKENYFFGDDHCETLFINPEDLKYLSKGKGFRSKIISTLGEILKLETDSVEVLSTTVEDIHNATLIHDDVLDNSHFRRNEKTLNAIYENNKAVLVGDYILANAMFKLSTLGNSKLISYLSIALKRLVDGEIFQLNNREIFDITSEDYAKLAKNKTGSLFSWCLTSVFMVGKYPPNTIQILDEIGLNIGLIFQMKDDLLDFSTKVKTPYLDLKNNNINYVFSALKDELSDSDKELVVKASQVDELPKELQEKIFKKIKDLDVELSLLSAKIVNDFDDFQSKYLESSKGIQLLSFMQIIVNKIVSRDI